MVTAMNDKAKALGLTHTHFADPTGLASENVSTAHDLAVLVQAAAQYPLIHESTTTGQAAFELRPGDAPTDFRNTNALVRGGTWDIELSKTGFIREAGRCLVMLAKIASRPVVIVLLDSIGTYTRVGDAKRVKYWLETGQTLPLPSARSLAPRSTGKWHVHLRNPVRHAAKRQRRSATA